MKSGDRLCVFFTEKMMSRGSDFLELQPDGLIKRLYRAPVDHEVFIKSSAYTKSRFDISYILPLYVQMHRRKVRDFFWTVFVLFVLYIVHNNIINWKKNVKVSNCIFCVALKFTIVNFSFNICTFIPWKIPKIAFDFAGNFTENRQVFFL